MVVDTKQSPKVRTVLLVDDADETRITTKWFLANFGYTVECARTAEEALSLFDPRLHDLVITDNSMPGMTGLEMAHVVKLRSPVTPVLMYSGNPPSTTECVDMVIQRPTHLVSLKEAVDHLVSNKSA